MSLIKSSIDKDELIFLEECLELINNGKKPEELKKKFDKKIKNPHNTKKKNYIFSLDDSEFGILFYIQSNVFKYDPYIIKLNKKNKSKSNWQKCF